MVTMTATANKPARTAPAAVVYDRHELVADMQRAVVEIWPDSTQAQLDRVAAQIRDRWGGCRPAYLGDDSQRRRRDADIRRLSQQGERVPYLARKFDLTERQIRRILQSDSCASG